MSKPVIGCVPYLNATPLIAWFATPEGVHTAEVRFAAPSKLADWLTDGTVDAILGSSFFALVNPGSQCCAGVSISSFGPVESVRLFSKLPISEIQTVALDSSSLTSAHLAQILLAERYGVSARAQFAPPVLTDMLATSDACVLIGDAGMEADASGLHVLDLGSEWHEMTGLPFVWALWIGGKRFSPALVETLNRAKTYGVERVEQIAREQGPKRGFTGSAARRYLAEIIDFDLSPAHLAGFSEYSRLCKVHGFLESDTLPEFVERVELANPIEPRN